MSRQTKHHAKVFLHMLLLVITAVFGSGCIVGMSSTLPPPLTATEKARLKGAHLPFTVGVVGGSVDLVSELRRTGVFFRVDHLDRFSSPPSFVARVEPRFYGGPPGPPFATLLSFGLIPTTYEEDFGFAFSLSPQGRETQRVLIEYSYRGRTSLGWVAMFREFMPDYSVYPYGPNQSRRFRGRLALAILDHVEDMSK